MDSVGIDHELHTNIYTGSIVSDQVELELRSDCLAGQEVCLRIQRVNVAADLDVLQVLRPDGEISRVQDRRLEQDVALKVLVVRPGISSICEDTRQT
jgi:hypothetical protein